MRTWLPLAAALSTLVVVAGTAAAGESPDISLLQDRGSLAVVAPQTFAGVGPWGVGDVQGGLPGLLDWFFSGAGAPPVDGTVGLLGQFWGVKGCAAGATCATGNLALLDANPDVAFSDTNPFDDTAVDTVSTRYIVSDALQVSTVATLRGGGAGSGASDFGESFVITNIGQTRQQGAFVQSVIPVLLALDPSCNCDPALEFFQALTSVNIDSQDGHSVQADGLAGSFEEVVNPGYDAFSQGIPAAMLGQLAPFLNLSSNDVLPLGFSLEWNFDLAPGQSFVLSKDKRIDVPEPGVAGLLGLGLVALVRVRRRRP